jgi:hypothetical protein
LTAITINDVDGPIEITFDDLKKFHGTRSICGLTVGYTVLRAAWEKLSDGEPLDRDNIAVETAFPGPGARDAVEMITRAVSREAFKVVSDKQPDEHIAEAAKGAYWYRITANGKSVELGLKQQVLPDDFIRLRRLLLAGEANEQDKQTFRGLQKELSSRLLSMDPLSAVNVLS